MNFPRPENDSKIGCHLSPNGSYPLGRGQELIDTYADRLKRAGFSWGKFVLTAAYTSDWQRRAVWALLNRGMMPILRYYKHKPYPAVFGSDEEKEYQEMVSKATEYWVSEGVHYFETIRNEGNLREPEWDRDAWYELGSAESRGAHIAEAYVYDAAPILNAGGIPITPALAPGGHDDDEVVWMAMLDYWHRYGHSDLMRKSGLGVHNYAWNRWQDDDDPLSFPDNKTQQDEWPGSTVMSGRGFSNCFKKYRYIAESFYNVFGFTQPVFSTEDGARWGDRQDKRYPAVTTERHTRYHEAVADYMARQAEDEYMCTAFWVIGSRELEAHGDPPPWEHMAWRAMYDFPGRPRELPIFNRLEAREFVRARTDIDWDFVEPSIKIVHVEGVLPVHPTITVPQRSLAAISKIIIHHTAGNPMATPQKLAEIGIDRGFSGASYHFYINGEGTIYQMRELNEASEHTAGQNRISIGVGFGGDFTKDPPTLDQMDEGFALIQYLMELLGINPDNVRPHNEFLDTECPGNIPGPDWWKALTEKEEPGPPDVPDVNQNDIRALAWGNTFADYNPASAFQKEAGDLDLGAPLYTEQRGVARKGGVVVPVLHQGFTKAILYVEYATDSEGRLIADWGKINLAFWHEDLP